MTFDFSFNFNAAPKAPCALIRIKGSDYRASAALPVEIAAVAFNVEGHRFIATKVMRGPERDMLADLTLFLDENCVKRAERVVWARDSWFDLEVLAHRFEAHGMPLPWLFNKQRDMRTIEAIDPVTTRVMEKFDSLTEESRHHVNALFSMLQAKGIKL